MTRPATRRCLLVSDARPARSGAADWRRFKALVEHYQMSGYIVDGHILADELIGAPAVARLREVVRSASLSSGAEAASAVCRVAERGDHAVVHVTAPWLGHALGNAPAEAVRVLDMLETPQAAAERTGTSLAPEEEDRMFIHAEIVVAADSTGVSYAEKWGRLAVVAPFVRQADRLRRPPVRGGAVSGGALG